MNILSDGFDSTKFYLGALCIHGHKWNEQELSLRYLNCAKCKECVCQRENSERRKAYRAKYYETNQQRILQQKKEHRLKNLDRYKAKDAKYIRENRDKKRAYCKQYYQKNAESMKAQAVLYYWENRDAVLSYKSIYNTVNRAKRREYWNKWRSTSRGKTFDTQSKAKRKALKLSNHHVPYSPEQWIQRLKDFNYCCAYCGKSGNLAQDHFISLSSGGCDTLNNLIPSCKSCNSSKSTKDPYEWFSSREFFSKQRWQFILKIIGKTQDNYLQLPLF